MGIEEWDEMLTTPIVVTQPSTAARSLYGSQQYSTAGVTFMAHVQEINGTRRKVTGFDGFCSSVVWMNCTSTSAATAESMFTFPDGSHPPVRACTYERDEDGTVHHTKVVFG